MRRWKNALQGLEKENEELYNWAIDILTHGTPIYRSEGAPEPVSAKRNLPVTNKDTKAITEWIESLLDSRYALGPFATIEQAEKHVMGHLTISPLFAVPKSDGRVRPVHHLSYGRDADPCISVNSEIEPEWATVKYVTFKEICEVILAIGANGYVWGLDLKDAYLQVLLRRADWRFMGAKWKGMYIILNCLMFGLASAPRIYTRFADAIEWAIIHRDEKLFYASAVQLIRHYLDDFFGGHTQRSVAQKQFQYALDTLDYLGVPVNRAKCTPPTQVITILGVEFDTRSMTARVTEKKVVKYSKAIRLTLKKDKVTRREIEHVVGQLRWAARCMPMGPCFVRRLETAYRRAGKTRENQRDSPFRLNETEKSNLNWWLHALCTFREGVDIEFLVKNPSDADIHVYTDASGNTELGFGGFSTENVFFQHKWSEFPKEKLKFDKKGNVDIYFGEFAAIVAIVELYAPRWKNRSVTFHCDNKAVYHSLLRKYTRTYRPLLTAFIHRICTLSAQHHFHFWIEWIEGERNHLADALSRYIPLSFVEYHNQVDLKQSLLVNL